MTSLWFTTRHGPALRDVVEWCNDFSATQFIESGDVDRSTVSP